MFDQANHFPDNVVNLFLGTKATQTEANAAAGQVVADSKCLENVARLHTGRGAGRTGADGNRLHGHHESIALNMGKAEVEVSRQALCRMAVEVDFVKLIHDANA